MYLAPLHVLWVQERTEDKDAFFHGKNQGPEQELPTSNNVMEQLLVFSKDM